MTKESMRKSVLVESLKDSVVPAANIDRTLEEDVELENIKSDVWETFEWGQGDLLKNSHASNQKGVWGQIDTSGRAN